jgi:hypothetical protein
MLGNIPAALLSWITVVGWEAVNLVIATFALYQLAVEVDVPAGNVTRAACLASRLRPDHIAPAPGCRAGRTTGQEPG